jgi:hypothetical protein
MDQSILEFYRRFGPYTDPLEYHTIYEGLPDDLASLCTLIKKQLIHPSQIKQYGDRLPAVAKGEDGRLTSVRRMLPELLKRNPAGLVMERQPQERLFVSCRNHALLLASILQYRRIPARVRVGFAEYISDKPGKWVDHWLCEVWDEAEERWLLVDPDIKRVDVPRSEFECAGNAWLKIRRQGQNDKIYGGGNLWGIVYVRQDLSHDFSACLGRVTTYWTGPPILHIKFADLSREQRRLLDQMALYLQNPDEHLAEMQALQAAQPLLQGEIAASWAPAEIKAQWDRFY